MNLENDFEDDCGCKQKDYSCNWDTFEERVNRGGGMEIFPSIIFYGKAYVPFQQNVKKLLTPDESICAGTVFEELYQPYLPERRG